MASTGLLQFPPIPPSLYLAAWLASPLPPLPLYLATVGPPWCRAAGVVLPGAGALSQQLVRVLHRPQLALKSRNLLPCKLLHALKLADDTEGRGGEGGG